VNEQPAALPSKSAIQARHFTFPLYGVRVMATIRNARPEDYTAYVRLFAELGVPDPVPSAARFAETIASQMRVAYRAEAEDDVVGYVTWRPYGAVAHVIQIAVDPGVRGQRVGERLLEHVRGEAKAAGCTRWYLNVKRDNAPALRLYDRVGLRLELESFAMKVAWANVRKLDAVHRLATPDEDAAIASAFRLPAERVAMFRSRGNFKLVTLRDEADALLGFAAFDPSFPGAATFSTVRPELGAALLAAMRAYADPAIDFVRVTVEGDRALADTVLALGAELTFELLRLSSPT
jgi:ribosomal protein S18 acetylase RimI-like enzyme